MAVYCGLQTIDKTVNNGEPGTAKHAFYHLITMPCLLVVFYFVFYFLSRSPAASGVPAAVSAWRLLVALHFI
jgi:hypothetical protein